MTSTASALLSPLAVLALIAPLYHQEKGQTTPPFLPRREVQVLCTRCRFREAKSRINPKSPTFAGPICAVRAGSWKCRVHDLERNAEHIGTATRRKP